MATCHKCAAALFLLLVLGIAGPVKGQDWPPAVTIREKIREFRSTPKPPQVRGIGISSMSILEPLYKANAFNPLWADPQTLDQLFQAIHAIDEDGLDPEDYHLSILLRMRSEGRQAGGSATAAPPDFDLLLTDSFIRLAYHLSYGKVNPRSLNPAWNFHRKIAARDPVPTLLDAIRSNEVFYFLDRLKTQVSYYLKLKAVLAVYRDIQRRGGWRSIPEDIQFVKGERSPYVAILRERLLLTGDLTRQSDDPELFDDAMEIGITHFKMRHNLGNDSAIYRTTVLELNRPVDYWIDKIKVNLERARWVAGELPRDFVIVDIAGFFVYVLRDGEIAWQSRIQVGGRYRQTPAFRSAIERVELNPSWTAPPGVVDALILPEARKDPQYIGRQGFTVINAVGKAVDPLKINWAAYSARTLPYRLRQGPGPENPMGRVKFYFPNEFLISLHDTPEQEAFEDSQRDFSFGCVRVEKPLEFAELLLSDPTRWSLERIQDITRTQKTHTIRLPRPMPIWLVYMTVFAERGGTLSFREDVYECDKVILEALNRRDEILMYPVIKRSDSRVRGVKPVK